MSELSGNICFKAVEGFEVTEVPDGFVIYDEPNDKVHYLNPTAAVIYAICDGRKSVSDIRDFLSDAYEIDELPDLDELFQTLETSGLVCRIG